MFIVLDGGDGTGKSTQIKRLDRALRAVGRDTLMTREPGGTPSAEKIRDLVLKGEPGTFAPTTELMLFNASRAEHLRKILPAIEAGTTVVCDRYVSSTLAYQGFGHGMSIELILDLHRIACADVWPDVTFLLTLDPEIALGRATARMGNQAQAEDRFEKMGADYHARVAQGYASLKGLVPNIVYIDANGTEDVVHGRLITALAALIATQAEDTSLPLCRRHLLQQQARQLRLIGRAGGLLGEDDVGKLGLLPPWEDNPNTPVAFLLQGGGYGFPARVFKNGQALPGLHAALLARGLNAPFEQVEWLVQPTIALEGHSPLEALGFGLPV